MLIMVQDTGLRHVKANGATIRIIMPLVVGTTVSIATPATSGIRGIVTILHTVANTVVGFRTAVIHDKSQS